MKVGIDARILFYNQSGIGRFAHGFLSALGATPLAPEVHLFRSWRDQAIRCSASISQHGLLTPSHFRFESVALKFELTRHRLSLLHALDFFAGVETFIPTICSVYDLYFLKNAEVLDAASRRHYSRITKAAQQAAHILTVSQATKRDIIELLGVPSENISVVYPGPPSVGAIDSGVLQPVKSKYHLDRPFILFVSTIEPRKNLQRLIQAYQLLNSEGADLVIVGRKGYGADEVLASTKSERIKYLGELADVELQALYRQAKVIAYPSLYEGFGFPVLEAMTAGVPLLTSRAGSLEEVAEDAAHYINPVDVEDIAAGLKRLLEDSSYCQQLIAKGLERVQHFSWQKCADEVLQMYQRVGAQL